MRKITLKEIEKNKILYKNIEEYILYHFGTHISIEEIIDIINTNKNIKELYYAVPQNIYEILKALELKIKHELKQRIKFGDDNIISRELSPYTTFIKNNFNNKKQIIKILENLIIKFDLINDIDCLNIIQKQFPDIQKFVKENSPLIKNNSVLKNLNKNNNISNSNVNFINLNNEYIIRLLNNSLYSRKIKKFLVKNQFTEQEIYIALLNFNFYDYNAFPLFLISSILGINKIRLEMARNDLITKLHKKRLITDFATFFPNKLKIIQILELWAKEGYNEKIALDKKENVTRKRNKNLLELLDCNKEQLDDITTKLTDKDIQLLNELYDDNYNPINNNLHSEKRKEKINLILKLKRRIAPKSENKKRNKALYQRVGTSKEELSIYIQKLNTKDQELLNYYYDEDYKFILREETKEELYKIRSAIQVIVYKLIKLKNNPDYKIRCKIKPSKNKNLKTLYEELNETLENTLIAIAKLPIKDQEFIRLIYDNNLVRIKKSKEKVNYYKLSKTKEKILMIIQGKIPVVKTKIRKNVNYRTLYQLLDVTKEELDLVVEKLSKKDKKILFTRYLNSYELADISYMNEKEKIYLNNQLMRIRKLLKTYLFPQEKIKNTYLCKSLNAEEIRIYIQKLPIGQQKFIEENFNSNYIYKNKLPLTDEITHRIVRIRANLKKIAKNPENITITDYSLLGRLNIPYDKLNVLILRLPLKDREVLFQYYDKDYYYEKKDLYDKSITRYINTRIIPKLKRYQKIENFDEKPTKIISETINYPKNKDEINKLSILEMIIITGVLTGEKYSTKSIAEFLNMNEEEVKEIIRNYLVKFQEKLSEVINKNENISKIRKK